jgi:hypothetical protein
LCRIRWRWLALMDAARFTGTARLETALSDQHQLV